jgi:hypothetical protein
MKLCLVVAGHSASKTRVNALSTMQSIGDGPAGGGRVWS